MHNLTVSAMVHFKRTLVMKYGSVAPSQKAAKYSSIARRERRKNMVLLRRRERVNENGILLLKALFRLKTSHA